MNWDDIFDVGRYIIGGIITFVSIVGGFIDFGDHAKRKKIWQAVYFLSIIFLAVLFGFFEYQHSKKEGIDTTEKFAAVAKHIDSTTKASNEIFQMHIRQLNDISSAIKEDINQNQASINSKFKGTIEQLEKANKTASNANESIGRTIVSIETINNVQAKELDKIQELKSQFQSSLSIVNQQMGSGFDDINKPLIPLSITYKINYSFESQKDSTCQAMFNYFFEALSKSNLENREKNYINLSPQTVTEVEKLNSNLEYLLSIIREVNYPITFFCDTSHTFERVRYGKPETKTLYSYSALTKTLTKTVTLLYYDIDTIPNGISNIEELLSDLVIEIPFRSFVENEVTPPTLREKSTFSLKAYIKKQDKYTIETKHLEILPKTVEFDPHLLVRYGNNLSKYFSSTTSSIKFSKIPLNGDKFYKDGKFEIVMKGEHDRSPQRYLRTLNKTDYTVQEAFKNMTVDYVRIGDYIYSPPNITSPWGTTNNVERIILPHSPK